MRDRGLQEADDETLFTLAAVLESSIYGRYAIYWYGDLRKLSDTIASMTRFEWDPGKDRANQRKHEVAFSQAQLAFADPDRVIAEDLSHGGAEPRFYCFGRVGGGVLTVRFTHRPGAIRIFGAGYWRKGKVIYEKGREVHE